MWHWPQGRLDYFQFDNLRKIAKVAVKHDLRHVDRTAMEAAIGLQFSPDKPGYGKAWRNYAAVFRVSMICAQRGAGSPPTPLAALLAEEGGTTTDEYLHFLAEAFTDPSPALEGWNAQATLRYPLLFAVKFLLAKAAIGQEQVELGEIVGAYADSSFDGTEDQAAFAALTTRMHTPPFGNQRQAYESLRVLGQISYLSISRSTITVSLTREDALQLFEQLQPITGTRKPDGADEVFRLTSLFDSAVSELELDYPSTVVSNVEEAGFSAETTFAEGAKIRKTHLVIERNSKIRSEFFKIYTGSVCEFCGQDTSKTYPWSQRVLDIHHLLPLCSGSRTSTNGTMLDDLVAICPTCHRAVHRYYDTWLKDKAQKDFIDAAQAKSVYDNAKAKVKLSAP